MITHIVIVPLWALSSVQGFLALTLALHTSLICLAYFAALRQRYTLGNSPKYIFDKRLKSIINRAYLVLWNNWCTSHLLFTIITIGNINVIQFFIIFSIIHQHLYVLTMDRRILIQMCSSSKPYLCGCFSGPSAVTIQDSDKPVAVVSNLQLGTYHFRLTVKDHQGLESSAVLSVTVQEGIFFFSLLKEECT